MHYPNPHSGRDEVKVAVLADQMRADDRDQLKIVDLLWGFAAIASALAIFGAIH